MKLKAMAATAKHPVARVARVMASFSRSRLFVRAVARVAGVMGVAAETVWRCAVANGEGGRP